MKSILFTLIFLLLSKTAMAEVNADDPVLVEMKSQLVKHIKELDYIFAEHKKEQLIQNDLHQKIAYKQAELSAITTEKSASISALDQIIDTTLLINRSLETAKAACSHIEISNLLNELRENYDQLLAQKQKSTESDLQHTKIQSEYNYLKIDLEQSIRRQNLDAEEFNKIKEWLLTLIKDYREFLASFDTKKTNQTISSKYFPEFPNLPEVINWPKVKTDFVECLNVQEPSECLGLKSTPTKIRLNPLDPRLETKIRSLQLVR